MKTITIILLSVLSFFASAQKVSIYYVYPGTLCPGDTLSIMFTWDNQPGYANFFIYGIGATSINNVNTNDFYSLTKVLIGNDTVYTYKIKTLPSFGIGPATVATDLVHTTPIWFICPPTALMKYGQTETQPTYTPFYGPILIEQTGNIRKKIIIIE